jgi:hypothetical protein
VLVILEKQHPLNKNKKKLHCNFDQPRPYEKQHFGGEFTILIQKMVKAGFPVPISLQQLGYLNLRETIKETQYFSFNRIRNLAYPRLIIL